MNIQLFIGSIFLLIGLFSPNIILSIIGFIIIIIGMISRRVKLEILNDKIK
jgi:membrane-bound ClpP family serine protease